MSPRSPRLATIGWAAAAIVLAATTPTGHWVLNRPTAPETVATTASQSSHASVDAAVAVRADVASYLDPYGSHASFALLDQVTGEKVLYQEDRAFETGSIVKVDILATLLWQKQQAGTRPSRSQRRLATAMITESDNGAASDLWDQIGGASGLAEANAAFGLTETIPGQDGYWGLTTTTAADQLRLLAMLAGSSSPLDSSSRAYLLDLMSQVEDDQRWGVPDAAGPQATEVYVKNGWLSRDADDGLWIINSIGRIVEPGHDWLIVALSNHNQTEDSGIALVQHAADLAVQNLQLDRAAAQSVRPRAMLQ